MWLLFGSTVLATVWLTAHALPADLNVPQKVGEDEKQHRQNLFGIGLDINLSKNGTLIPSPAFINTSGSYGAGIGAGGNFIIPLVPFPLGLLFPQPPLNITLGFSANKNISGSLVASTGNNTVAVEDNGWPQAAPSGWPPASSPSGWGWATSTTTPPPSTSGWGWSPPTPGWSPPPSTTTPGWSPPPSTTAPGVSGNTATPGWGPPPPTTPGWSPPPPTTPGWSPPPPTTTPGWSPPPSNPGWSDESEPSTGWEAPSQTGWQPPQLSVSGWGFADAAVQGGWQMRKGHGSSNVGVNKPQSGPKPNKPASNKPNDPSSSAYSMTVAQSVQASELPSVDIPVQAAEPLQVAQSLEHAPAHIPLHAEELLQAVENIEDVPAPMPLQAEELFQAMENIEQVPVPMPLQAEESFQAIESIEQPSIIILDDIPMQVELPELIPIPESPMDNLSKRVPVNSVAGKSKRHAGVEVPAVLRIGDFEDVESPNVVGQEEMSKEEMIIMAMEQNNHVLPGAGARPAPRPSLNQLQAMNKPIAENVDELEDASAIDLRLAESSVVSASEINANSKSVSKGKPESDASQGERGGKNKPRPYGMDKPSKNRPNLDSGVKNEQFGLPHYSSDSVQKEQFQLPSGSSVLGWQVPEINWSSFATIFQNLLGSNHKKNSMAKSDNVAPAVSDPEKCVEEDEDLAASEAVRSHVISGGGLCPASSGCSQACLHSGFSGGNCLGPPPTPGCMCKVPNHKELGMMLTPLKTSAEDLETSVSAPCKKCACAESCKATGSYTGFCIDQCYCAVPWFTKEV